MDSADKSMSAAGQSGLTRKSRFTIHDISMAMEEEQVIRDIYAKYGFKVSREYARDLIKFVNEMTRIDARMPATVELSRVD